MNKICTTIEQSKKLIELGIDIKTADMYWEYDFTDHECVLKVMDIHFGNTCIPAWSLSALLKMLPLPTIEETMITTTETKWKCTIYCESYAKFWSELHNDAIDAAFEMVCWLKKRSNFNI